MKFETMFNEWLNLNEVRSYGDISCYTESYTDGSETQRYTDTD